MRHWRGGDCHLCVDDAMLLVEGGGANSPVVVQLWLAGVHSVPGQGPLSSCPAGVIARLGQEFKLLVLESRGGEGGVVWLEHIVDRWWLIRC